MTTPVDETFPRGKHENPVPLQHDQDVVKLKCCPDCDGRGYFMINPFATGGGGFGGVRNMCQCLTCANAMIFYRQHGRLPTWLQEHEDRRLAREAEKTA